MNLTIPVMKNQTLKVELYDNKTKKIYTFSANIHRIVGIESGNNSCIFRHDFNCAEQNLMIKGFGRNKKWRKPNIKIGE